MATKAAIGKMTQDALYRIQAAMSQLVTRLGVESLDIASVQDRDPAYEHGARLMYLAGWLESLNDRLDEVGVNMSGAHVVSDRLDLIQMVLDEALESRTKKQLAVTVKELGLDVNESCIKAEFINEIVVFLTGRTLESEMEDGIEIEVEVMEDELSDASADVSDSDSDEIEDIHDLYDMAEDIAETAMELMDELDEDFEDEETFI